MANKPQGPKGPFNKAAISKVLVWSAIAMAVYGGMQYSTQKAEKQALLNKAEHAETQKKRTVPYTDFVRMARANEFKRIERLPDGDTYMGTNGDKFPPSMTIAPSQEILLKDLEKEFNENKLTYNVMPQDKKLPQMMAPSGGGGGGGGGGWMGTVMMYVAGAVIFFFVFRFLSQKFNGGGGGNQMGAFAKSKARMLDENDNKTTFVDVAGCDEAKEEVKEVVDFLKEPGRFKKLGGQIPRGLLLVGPPGTGKTLLAKAMAGEAKVPFFSISGSDFVEMFVGVGAARVRDMFENAKKNAPCIIFIDEIDAIGKQRGNGMGGGGNDEREQTLNQMLVEMDGFETNLGVIVVAATNRPDVLDSALLRPGRFDRQVYVTLPDIKGREQILHVHMKKIPLHPQINPSVIARGTPGMSGADLANLCNEAALMAGRRKARVVEMQDFEKAKDKIFMGPERKSMVMPEEERKNTAYHETGHMLMNRKLKNLDPFYKMTIIPRGRALGVSMSLPEQDRFSVNKARLKDELVHLYGGQAAEIYKFGAEYVTTGASNDIERASAIARNMITKYGMSDSLGKVRYATGEGMSMLGPMATQMEPVSERTKEAIDAEVKDLTDTAHAEATRIILENADLFEKCAMALLKYETLTAAHVDAIEKGEDIDAIMEAESRAEHLERIEANKANIANDLAAGSNDNKPDDKGPDEKAPVFPLRGPGPGPK